MNWFSSNKAVIAQKRAEREKALATATAYSPENHGPYIHATASEIVKNIESGTWTASQVLEAYIARAAFVQTKTNFATEVFFDNARRQAKEIDAEFEATKKLKGPLHGVPVSVKDVFCVAGYDTSIGYSLWTGKPATEDAHFVSQLRAAGAIPFVKTNVPQTLLSFECNNPVWGRTTNPWNDYYSCGGSSGGEAAVLAMDGSAIGLGSDIGGSLRIPASYCGIYSLKPSYGRISEDGGVDPDPGFDGIKVVFGPMARSVSDLELVCRHVFGVQDVAREVAPIPYQEVKLPKKLRVGYYTSDGFVKASPANKRAVLETVEALRKQGHECTEVEISGAKAANIFVSLTCADKYQTLLQHLGPDKRDESLFLITLAPKLPGFVRRFAAWAVKTFMKDEVFSSSMREAGPRSCFEYKKVVAQRIELVKDFYKQVWDKHQFDCIICPVQAVPALRHGDSAMLSPLATATILYNVLDNPAGVIPVTRVDPEKDKLTDEWTTGPGLGSRTLEDSVYRGGNPLYDPTRMKGLPVGVQIAGRKWEDEKVLAIMHIVDEALGPRGFGPGCWDEKMSSKK